MELITTQILQFHNIWFPVRISSGKKGRKKIEECYMILTLLGSYLVSKLLKVMFHYHRVHPWATGFHTPRKRYFHITSFAILVSRSDLIEYSDSMAFLRL